MTSTTDTYALLRAFVDELARCGMRAACTSPGSRSAPLALTLAGEQRLRCYSHIDERCSGFFALGLAKASALPVAVTCTSGTAVAELLPAAVEAHEARVPLLLLTADRPPELRENGAGQAIDQLGIFGGVVKWFFEVGTHDASPERVRWMRTLACRAYWTSLEGRPGPVHLNFPLREPLVSDEQLPGDRSGRANGRPYVSRRPARVASGAARVELLELVSRARRGVLVAGRHERDDQLASAAARFAAGAEWPLLADPLSGARRGQAAIAHYDAVLRDPSTVDSLQPDLVVRVGDLPVSKPLRSWLAGLDSVPQVTLNPEGAWQDPDSVISHSFALDPTPTLLDLGSTLEAGDGEVPIGDGDWLAAWRSADELASQAIGGVLAESGLSEPVVARELGVLLSEETTLFVASSMPVRDIETFWPARADPPRVLCNRGANGIDGIVSSAYGAAAGEGPVVLLIGDVALAHDIGGLLAGSRLGLKLTIVLLDNGGGGIFDFLPVSQTSMAQAPDPHGDSDESLYARHITTATGLDFAKAAALYGLAHERAEDVQGFRAALERALAADTSSIVEVRTSRAENVELHRHVWRAVSDR